MTTKAEEVKILNCVFQNYDTSTLLKELQQGVFFNPNMYTLMTLQKDKEFYDAVQNFEYTIVDSQYVSKSAKFLGQPFRDTIPGSDFFPQFCEYHKNNNDIKIFLLGAGPNVAKRASENLNRTYGREMVVGEYSPPFGFEKDEEELNNIVEKINATDATVLVVGLGNPKQEKWVSKNRHKLQHVKIFLMIGAAIDFESNPGLRAPKWIRSISMEWFYRLLKEPKRMWKRYLVICPPFFYYLVLQKLGRYKNPFA